MGPAILLAIVLGAAPADDDPGPDPAERLRAADHFEAKVRPVLVAHCVACHGPDKQKAGLRLDSAEGLRKGSEGGPVVTPGDPDDSPLIAAIRYDDVARMPPKGKLPDEAIRDLTEWVRRGAHWPESNATAGATTAAPEAVTDPRDHWAFRPVADPSPPEVADEGWAVAPVDRFILAALEAKGIAPSPLADRRTLIRRVTFDLIGLPPTPEEVDAFLDDPAPDLDAFARVVDRLLASPHYGERWGRHWLDVARYADTKGYVYSDREESRFPTSWTYRDYVIRAFNDDKPYDRFLKEQIAADRLVEGGDVDRPALAAMGFLTLGRRFLGNAHDIVDDRIDVVFRGTQALTVGCARCHDHKFDPVPIDDYYSLYGVFSATSEAFARIGDPTGGGEERREYEEGLARRQKALDDALEAKRAELSEQLRGRVADYLAAVPDARRLPGDEFYVILQPDEVNPTIVKRWRAFIDRSRGSADPVFGPWHAFEALPASSFEADAAALAARFAASDQVNPRVARIFDGPPPASMGDVAGRYGELLKSIHATWTETLRRAAEAKVPPPAAGDDPAFEELRQVLYADDAPTTIPAVHINQLEFYFPEKVRVELCKLQMEIDRWNLGPASAPHALILRDRPEPRNPRVFLRGNPKTPGAEVPRRFLKVLSGPERAPFRRGAGRLDLAEAIARPDNPLTARVMVNRVWMHHFGQGLVRTPSDFGTRGEPPTHPGLLDWLASRFVEGGWSIKALHRQMLLTSTYRQRSDDVPASRAADPENRLLWRMNRRRLDWESLRDALIVAGGRLEATVGGRPVRLTERPFPMRRTVYGFVDRQDLPGVFRVFNLASPDQHTPQRHATTIPQQALFLMNSPFVLEQARSLAARPELARSADPEARVAALYRIVYQREPSAAERAVGRAFLASAPEVPPAPERRPSPWRYGSGSFDEASGRLADFAPLAHWAGDAWQPDPTRPDSTFGRLRLTREGGHPGPDPAHAAVRRWVSPIRGVVAVEGKLARKGDGPEIRAAIVSSRAGAIGRWEAKDAEVETKLDKVEVEPGETLDLVVARGGDFAWPVTIRVVGPRPGDGSGRWRSDADFAGPPPEPLTAWEAYAQAILLSNEFAFVD